TFRAGTSLAVLVMACAFFANMRGAVGDGLRLAPSLVPDWRVEPVVRTTWPWFVAVLLIVAGFPIVPRDVRARAGRTVRVAALAATCLLSLFCALAVFQSTRAPSLDEYSTSFARAEVALSPPGEPPSSLSVRSGVGSSSGDERGPLGAVDPASIAASTAPPSRWIWLGLAGLFTIAVAHVLRAQAAAGHARMLARAREGTLREQGRIDFEDGLSVSLDSAAPIPPGPVIVLGVLAGPATPYREAGTVKAEHVIPGSLADHRRSGIFDTLRRDMGILAVAALMGAPLFAAASAGLLGFAVPSWLIPRPTHSIAVALERSATASATVTAGRPGGPMGMPGEGPPVITMGASAFPDLDGDGVEDFITTLAISVPAVSGPQSLSAVAAFDGRTFQQRWLARLPVWTDARHLVVSGEFVALAGQRTIWVLALASGAEQTRLVPLGEVTEACAPAEHPGKLWVDTPVGSVFYRLDTGLFEPAPRPRSCPATTLSSCRAGFTARDPCGPAPSDAQTAALKERDVVPRIVIPEPRATLVIGDRSIYSKRGAGGAVALAFQPDAAGVLWERPLGEPPRYVRQSSPATVANGVLYTVGWLSVHHILALDIATGKMKWQFPIPGDWRVEPEAILARSRRVYVHSAAATFVLDATTGELLSRLGGR
ncbi:MAG: PQQ-binding-like beta-propeller repeat protein, partial [Polyangiaceae bacterium]